MVKPALTKRQKQLLEVIYRHIKDTGYPPSFEEMKDNLGLVSNQSILDLLAKLEGQKLIKRRESQARGIAILPLGYSVLVKPPIAPFLGITHAGAPLEVVEVEGQWEELPGGLARLESDIFILKVSGDSMINAGIDDGDKVLVQSKKEFISGDIVLADIDGESTVKRFISDDNPPYVYLKPENPNYTVIPFTDRMRLVGKIISILKEGYWKSVN